MWRSKEDVERNMTDAITFHVDEMHREGLAVPQPHTFSTYSEVSA